MAVPYKEPLLRFDDVSDGVDGVIFKAGLRSSTVDRNGIGVNGAVTGSNVIFSDGGVSTSTTNVGADKVEITIPSADRAKLRFSGRIQFDVKAADAVNVVTQNNAKLSLRDATDAVQGPLVRINGSTNITTNNHAYGFVNTLSYCVLNLDPAWSPNVHETENSQSVFFTDEEEWVTLTISWSGGFHWWSINGHTVTKSRHTAFAADPAYIRLDMISSTLEDRIPIRNLILCDHPAPDTHEYYGPDVPRVITIGHSFWATAGGLIEWEYDTNERMGSIHHLTNNIHKTYTERYGPLWMKNLAHDGSVRATGTVIEGHAVAMTKSNLTFDWSDTETIENRYLKWQPHFALLMCHGSDSDTAVVDTNLTTILDALKADGVIPIVVREQNRDAGGIDRTAIDAQVQTTVANWRAANGGDNACGLVDLWTPTGGSTVNRDYVEIAGAKIHPSLDVGYLYGDKVAREIRRLFLEPPYFSTL